MSFVSQTNKSRQKRERKRFSLKEGSPNEHLALVAELHKIVVQADQWKGLFEISLPSF